MNAEDSMAVMAHFPPEVRQPLPNCNAEWTFNDKLHARSLIAGALGFVEAVCDQNPHLAIVADPFIAEIKEALGRE